VFAVHRLYYREALDFDRALKARNGLLRRGEFSRELLESYDETLARTGARVVARRREVVRRLAATDIVTATGKSHWDRSAKSRKSPKGFSRR